MLGEGATELVKNAAASADQLAAVRALFDTMGVTVTFQEETMLNEVIPYAGSAPAYIYAFAAGMVRSAEAHGIAYDDAMKLFCQTMIGSAKMLLAGEKTPDELIGQVCSPGGTTLEAIKVLKERDLAGMLAAGAGATAIALLKKKKREEVYHEAELKAMNELDDLMNECDGEGCADCSCAEECAAVDAPVVETEPEEEESLPEDQQEDDLDEEADDEPIQDVEAEDKPAE